ncbi:uncharacterized protein LOC120330708 isoform X1 [Styela clava]|uniref:leucine-rich repeat-containing protein 74B-like isoform X1 n=1 Tax=Styela clava TaxID=7725 RepID=UPI00193A8E97|nr:leucine-rich repeat-containing protein 74B-like isoform X1 [Styela clava]XP_039255005.1 leucine-rich repeat-containing protein 74B-like isoform X2 [Styela clava]
MPEPGPEPGEGAGEVITNGKDENAPENIENQEDNLLDIRASPTARPQSRGSVSPTRKTISRISSAHSTQFARPRSGSSQGSVEIRDDKDDDAASDGGYDTDLEIEANREEYDTTGKTTYKEACKQFGVIPVSYFLRHMQDTELIMRHHGLGPAGGKAIAVSLVSNTRILKLDLSDNWLSGKGGAAIADMLEENCYITELILSDNKLGYDGAKAICAMLQKNDNINRVNISGNEFASKAAEPIAELLMSNTQKVEFLNLSENHFDEPSGEILGPAIAENTSIKEINLSWNYFRRGGAVAMAKGIGANIFLKSVNISWNGMGLEGATTLGEALKTNNVLEELDVSNNRISTEGAILLAKGLLVNDTLRILHIGKNPMQSAGAFGILTALKENSGSAIEHLGFTDIVVNKDFVDLEKEVKENRPKLVIIHGGAESEKKKPKARPDPMTKIRKYVEENNMRLVDFFNSFDEDSSMSITREELQRGVEQAGIMLTQDEMKQLLELLDKDGDGEINYSELVIGNLEYLQKEKEKKDNEEEDA